MPLIIRSGNEKAKQRKKHFEIPSIFERMGAKSHYYFPLKNTGSATVQCLCNSILQRSFKFLSHCLKHHMKQINKFFAFYVLCK